MKYSIRTAIAVTGFSGIAGQMILLRELLIVFSGNEFTIGIILANWLILEAFGSSIVGRGAGKSRNPLFSYGILTLLFSLSLPAMVYAARMARIVLGVSIGQVIGILPVLYTSCIILLPVSILHGALFTYGCRVYRDYTDDDASAAGRAYVYETVGTVLGGVLWTYLFIPHLPTFHTAAGISAVGFLLCAVLLVPSPSPVQRTGGVISVLLLAGTAALFIGGQVEELHRRSIAAQWAPQNLVEYRNSRYSSIAVVEQQNQFTFFLDGMPHLITPVPDVHAVEEFVHLPLLSHPDPKQVLILSGGAGGVINEVLKHASVEEITYAELDPTLIELIREHSTDLTEGELTNPKVQIAHIDGRLYLKKAPDPYDIVLVGIRELADLQSNRFFTHEFFSLADARMENRGILAFTIPGSLTYLSDELKNLNSTVFHTVNDVFPYVRVIPGDGSNLFLASRSPGIMELDVPMFITRGIERNITQDVLIPRHLENKLHPGWMNWYHDFIEGKARTFNRDFRPVGVYYSISHWNSLLNPALQPLFSYLGGLRTASFALLLPAAALTVLVRLRKPRFLGSGISLSIGTSGFTGMIFDLALIFSFQALYGYVISWIGVLVALFMVGSALGAALITAAMPMIINPRKWYLFLEAGVLLYALVMPAVFLVFQPLMDSPAVFSAFRVIIPVLSCISGFCISAQFPLANRLYAEHQRDFSSTVGVLYGSDLLGGWMGGIIGGVVLLPVLGLMGTCITAALLKAFSFCVVITDRPEMRRNYERRHHV